MTKEEIIELAKKIVDENEFAMVGTISLKKYPNVRTLKKNET